MSSLEQQIKSLTKQVARMQAGRNNQPRGRSKSRGRQGARPRSQSRKRQGGASRARTPGPSTPRASFNAGHARIAKRELLVSIKTDTNGVATKALTLNPTNADSQAGYLKTMGGIFDEMKWNRLVLHWIPAVGNTVGGLISFGFDWDTKVVTDIKQGTVTALSPSMSGKLNQERSMTIPASQYQRQRWLAFHSSGTEASLGSLVVYVTGPPGTDVGMFELDYDVEFQGTKLP